MVYFIIVFVIFLFFLYMVFEASFVQVNTHRFAKEEDCLKVVHLSDIHIQLLRVSPKRVQKIIANERPDIIIITGDYIDKKKHIPSFIEFLNTIKLDVPTYLCLGNHDYKTFSKNSAGLSRFIQEIEKNNAFVLENKAVCIEMGDKKFNLIGISDKRFGSPHLKVALNSLQNPDLPIIAFTHNPELVLSMPEKAVDYLLCGHFHGGQIWAPFRIEFRLLRSEKLSKMGITRGLHKMNDIHFYINRGLGNVWIPLRFLSRPEIAVFYIPDKVKGHSLE